MDLNKIAVFGSTGEQGGAVARELIERGVRVRAIARSQRSIDEAYGNVVESSPVDLLHVNSIEKALEGVDGAFFHFPLLSGPAERQAQLENVLSAARITGLPKLVFTTSGFSDPRLAASRMVAGNLAAERAVLSSGVPSVVLKPTAYLENLFQPHTLAQIFDRGILSYPIRPASRKLSWTGLRDQARIAVAALGSEAATGRGFYIASPGALSGDELAARLSESIGRKVEYIAQDPPEFEQGLAAVFGSETARVVAELYEEIEKQPEDWGVVDLEPVLSLLDVELEDAADWISVQDWNLRSQSAKTLSA